MLKMGKPTCQRHVDGKICGKGNVELCKDHNSIFCIVCNIRKAILECRVCKVPICTTCKHHDSFGY